MRTMLLSMVAWAVSALACAAQEVVYRSTLAEQSVETRDLLIVLEPVDEDVRFSITLHNTQTGFERQHEFDGEGASDPSPFQLTSMHYCGSPVVLLTIQYPWRHELPQYVRVLETFAFRTSDFAFVDKAFGPLTDIALLDSQDEGAKDLEMQPPVLVQCLSSPIGPPFRFVMKTRY
ncbi:MAG: hypothetical protein R3D56_10085 [Paracoccaceae bacterium]|jgi:hypothetical protein